MSYARLFDIIHTLSEERTVTAKTLAGRLEVSERTILRDVERLSEAGMPIYASRGRGGGISLLPGYVMDKAALSETDRQSILASLKALDTLQPNAGGDTMPKLAAMFGQLATDRANWIEVDFSSWAAPEGEQGLFEALREAVLEKKCAAFHYTNTQGRAGKRTVEPLKLGFRHRGWYLYAWCRTKKDFRFFKLTRIKKLRVTDEHFDRLAPARIFGDTDFGEADKFILLRLRIAPRMAFRVYDEFITYRREKDGYFTCEVSCPETEWLQGYISSFGADCEVLAPESVRAAFVRELQATLSLYKGKKSK
ncbi:MAG: YafY family transcriptional regulator [Clostridiales Family XIII bacterium]|jgi:predicted DNA-binding transcriptional regulator YafY|nr:YafY family transcriptional regulator [Clostridiales Family XIII bacterium]